MRIAVTSSNGENVDLHLGKGSSLYIYDFDENQTVTFIEKRNVDIDPRSKHQGVKVLDSVKDDCQVIISAQFGFKSKMNADDLGIKLVTDEGPIEEVLQRYVDHYNFMKK